MNSMDWIKELVQSEKKMEESGVIDFSTSFDSDSLLKSSTLDYIKDIKTSFIEASSAFNELKGTTLGNIKVYAISKTVADFMLFRNGYKLIFAIEAPGKISIQFSHIGNSFIPGQTSSEAPSPNRDSLVASWGPFGEIFWTFKGKKVQLDYLIRYYLTRFIKESAK